MRKVVLSFAFAALALAQYRTEGAGAPPDQVAGPIRDVLGSGVKVIDPNGFAFAEVWFRNEVPGGSVSSIPDGALVGVIRFAGPGADRSGRGIRPGVYTMRATSGGVRLVPAADDKDPETAPSGGSGRVLTLQAREGGESGVRMTSRGEVMLDTTFAGQGVSLLLAGVA